MRDTCFTPGLTGYRDAIEAYFKQLPNDQFIPSVQSAKYPVINAGNFFDNTLIIFVLGHKQGFFNTSGYEDAKVDAYVKDIYAATSEYSGKPGGAV